MLKKSYDTFKAKQKDCEKNKKNYCGPGAKIKAISGFMKTFHDHVQHKIFKVTSLLALFRPS